jgi:DNA-binding beta-propeller fold protein YncE
LQGSAVEQPSAIAIDQDNNIYVTNEKGVNGLQKISADGMITTLLDRGATQLIGQPYVDLSLAIDRTGRIILGIGGRGTVEQLGKDGTLTVLAGQSGKKGMLDGPANKAQFKAIAAVAVGLPGDIYIADSRTIRKLSTDGIVSTLAGYEHTKVDYRDGRGRTAAFGVPKGLVVDDAGNVFVADGSIRQGEGSRSTSFGLIRKIDQTGLVTSIAGDIRGEGGYLDGEATDSEFMEPFGMAMNTAHDLFVTEQEEEIRFAVRKVSASLEVTTILNAGALADFEKDRDGADPALYMPTGIALDRSGKVYIVDTGGNKLHRLDKQALVTQAQPKRYSDAYITTLCALVVPSP